MRVELKRIDSWFTKGFEGITNLMIGRSQSAVRAEHAKMLEQAISNLKLAISIGFKKPKEDLADDHMFPMLLQLSNMLLARVSSDESLDRASVDAVKGYIGSLETALSRFYELGSSRTESLERDHKS